MVYLNTQKGRSYMFLITHPPKKEDIGNYMKRWQFN